MSHTGDPGDSDRSPPQNASLKRKRETSPASTEHSDGPNASAPRSGTHDAGDYDNRGVNGVNGFHDPVPSATQRFTTDETRARVTMSPVALDSPPQHVQPLHTRPETGESAVLAMLGSIPVSEVKPRRKTPGPKTATMIFLTPNDLNRQKTIPRLGMMDFGAAVSITYESVLRRAELPFYYHDVGNTLVQGVNPGELVKPIGTAALFWHEDQSSPKGASQIYQTAFLVLPDDVNGREPQTDFLLGREWLEEAAWMMIRRQSEDDGVISDAKGGDTVFFAAQVEKPPAGA